MSALNEPHQLQLFSLFPNGPNGSDESAISDCETVPSPTPKKSDKSSLETSLLEVNKPKTVDDASAFKVSNKISNTEETQPVSSKSIFPRAQESSGFQASQGSSRRLSLSSTSANQSNDYLLSSNHSDVIDERMELQAVLNQSLSTQATAPADYEKRIFHLEQALDQALIYLQELGTQVKNQHQLDEKLASMEDYAYVQYQAITHLQNQVAQYQATLSEQESSIAKQIVEKETTDKRTVGEKQTGETAASSGNQALLATLKQRDILQQENAQWKHACQELQQECDRQHRKLVALEQEKATMQEQILQQVRHLDEGETAIQYWKDQHALQLHQIEQLQHLIHRFSGTLENMNIPEVFNGCSEASELLGLLNSINREIFSSSSALPSIPSSSANSLALPDFLVRRYHQRFDQLSDSQIRQQGPSSA